MKEARHTRVHPVYLQACRAHLWGVEGGAAPGQWGWRDFWAPSGPLIRLCLLQNPRAVAYSHARFCAEKENIYIDRLIDYILTYF